MQLSERIDALVKKLGHPALPGIDLSLDRMRRLLAALGDPHKRLPPVIHVAGTNGKGSTIAFMRAMLEADGKRVHVYTSPELMRFNERIVLAGKQISDETLLPLLEQVFKAVQKIPATSFEAATAVAFLAFAHEPADVLLLEVGMGGRLDATNVIDQSIASVITPIARDHVEFLGVTLAEIAQEKAGIIKPGAPVFSARQHPEVMEVINNKTNILNSKLKVIDDIDETWPLGLEGAHQHENAALAMLVLKNVMKMSDAAIRNGLKNARWPARLQKLNTGLLVEHLKNVWLDGGHNAHAAAAIAAWAHAQRKPVGMICGLMARKEAAEFFAPLSGAIDSLVTIPLGADAHDAPFLRAKAQESGIPAQAADGLDDAITLLKRDKPATVIVAGSLRLAGAVLKTHE